MKYSSLISFEKHLDSASPQHVAPVYLILSKVEFERKRALDKFKALFKESEKIPTFEGDPQGIGSLLCEIRSLSLFAKKKVLHLQLTEKTTADVLEPLLSPLSHLPKDTLLIITKESMSSKLNFYKAIEKAGVILEMPFAEKPWEKEQHAQQYLQNLVTASQKTMDTATSQWMIQQVGTDAAILFQEFEKLLLYVGEGKVITKKEISAICNRTYQDNIFQLGEAIFQRRCDLALQATHSLLDAGLVHIVFLRQLRSQFVQGFQIALAEDAGAVSQLFPYLRGNILSQKMTLSKQYGKDNFRKGLIAIDEAENAIKSVNSDHDTLMDLLILKLTQSTL